MEKLHLPIIIEMDEDGYYIVSCPLFRGCHSYGETMDEALENIQEVIEMCMETRIYPADRDKPCPYNVRAGLAPAQ
ncbi:type II toxin-antitoxin system HicB family antitoxin [candidate division WOR-3 bacterium]|nr:type II toxin-antitoxin system HicB family antitoxin [candidate division WOR-3 bacterium]